MPLLIFVRKGKRIGQFLTVPYTVIDEVLSLSDVPAYVNPIRVSGVYAVKLTPAEVHNISVPNADTIASDSVMLVRDIIAGNIEDVDTYMAVLPTDTQVSNSDLVLADASVLIDADIMENVTTYSALTPVMHTSKPVTQTDADASSKPVMVVDKRYINPVTFGEPNPVMHVSKPVGQSVSDVSDVAIVGTAMSIASQYGENSLTSVAPEPKSVTYTLFWLPPVPIMVSASAYTQYVKSLSDVSIASDPKVAEGKVAASYTKALSPNSIATALNLKYKEFEPVTQVPKTFSTSISLKVLFPESGAVASEAYSAFIVMALQRDTNSVGATNVSSESLVLSLSTTTNSVASTATAL